MFLQILSLHMRMKVARWWRSDEWILQRWTFAECEILPTRVSVFLSLIYCGPLPLFFIRGATGVQKLFAFYRGPCLNLRGQYWRQFCDDIVSEIRPFTRIRNVNGFKNFHSESGLKNFRICLRFRRMRVNDSRIRKEKVADSKISGYGWTGPKLFPSVVQMKFHEFDRSLLPITEGHLH